MVLGWHCCAGVSGAVCVVDVDWEWRLNWCAPHWAQLRSAVERFGLTQFCAEDGRVAAARLLEHAEGGEETFDPLLGSWERINATMARSLTAQGRAQEILLLKCPLCTLVEDGQPQLVSDWIDGCLTSAKAHAISEGWLQFS